MRRTILNMTALVGGYRSAGAGLDVRGWSALGICLLLPCVSHGIARAQPAADKAAADALFNEGKKLISVEEVEFDATYSFPTTTAR